MGGEKVTHNTDKKSRAGSPPRGRGKVRRAALVLFFLRDHPRVGGEKLVIFARPAQLVGITPAWAGKRFSTSPMYRFFKDHPRVGGEKPFTAYLRAWWGGSPPRGRGKVLPFSLFLRFGRITPAWAGKRSPTTPTGKASQDHPRVGGEKRPSSQGLRALRGSPPRGRGKGGILTGRVRPQGITPAWAGKRLKRSHRSGIFISGPIPFHSVLHRPAGSGGSRAGRDGSPAGQPQNAGPA